MADLSTRTGKCLCGAVRFTAEAEDHFHACHCGMCRKWAGGPLLAAVCPEATFEGGDITRYQSSPIAERGFCTACGAHLFYYSVPAGLYVIPIGAFDDQTGLEMSTEIYVDEQPGSYAFAGDRLRMTGEEFIAAVTAQAKGEG